MHFFKSIMSYNGQQRRHILFCTNNNLLGNNSNLLGWLQLPTTPSHLLPLQLKCQVLSWCSHLITAEFPSRLYHPNLGTNKSAQPNTKQNDFISFHYDMQ